MKLAEGQLRTFFGQNTTQGLALQGVSRGGLPANFGSILTNEGLMMPRNEMDASLMLVSELQQVDSQYLEVLSSDRAIVAGPVRAGRMIVPRYQDSGVHTLMQHIYRGKIGMRSPCPSSSYTLSMALWHPSIVWRFLVFICGAVLPGISRSFMRRSPTQGLDLRYGLSKFLPDMMRYREISNSYNKSLSQ